MTFPSKPKRKNVSHHPVFEKFYDKPHYECEWAEKKLRLRRFQHALLYMVESYLRHGYFDWDEAGRIAEPSNPTPGLMMKRVFKSRTISGAHDELLTAKMQELGLTDEFVAQALKTAFLTAQEKGDAATMVRIAAEINKMKGNYIQRQAQITETETATHNPLPSAIMAEYHQIRGHEEPLQLPQNTTEEEEHGTEE